MKIRQTQSMTARLFFSLVVCAVLTLPGMSWAANSADPYVHYKLEESAAPFADAVNTDAGVEGTCASCPSTTTGIAGEALTFDGASDNFVNVSTEGSVLLNMAVDRSFSVAAWVKRDRNISDTEVFLGRDGGTGNMQIWLALLEDGSPAFSLRDEGGVGAERKQVTASRSVADGEWHLVAGVYDATADEMHIYVDGEAAATPVSASFTAGFSSPSIHMTIGALNVVADFPFSGAIDEAAFFNVALTAQDVASHYAGGNNGLYYQDLFAAEVHSTLPGTGYVGYPFSRQVGVTGNPLPASDDFELVTFPSDMTVGQSTGLITWTPSSEHVGDNTVDVEGNSSSASPASGSFTITVADLCSSDLASYWKLEEEVPTFADATPNSKSGTCTNCPERSSTGGALGEALTFDGSNDHVIIEPGTDDHLDIAIGESVSVVAWVKRASGISSTEVIVGRDEGGTAMQLWLGITASGTASFSLRDDSNTDHQVTGTTVIADGAWHLVAGVYDAVQGQMHIYVDGLEEADTAVAAVFGDAFVSASVPLVIGALNDTPQFLFEGDIDEVAFIKGALDEDMVTRMYDNSWTDDKGYFCQNDPVISSGAADGTVADGTQFSYDGEATDADGDTLTWSLSGAPSGMQVNASTGVVTWTPARGVTTSGNVTLRVDDGYGGRDSLAFVVTVTASNTAPVITGQVVDPISMVVDTPRDIVLADLVATDADGDTLTLASVAATGGNCTVSGVTVTPISGYTGTLTVLVVVTDGTDTSNGYHLNLLVNDASAALEILSTATTTVNAGETYSYTPSTSRPQATLTWELSNAPTGMSVDAATGVVTWTPADGITTSGEVTLTVTDGTESDTETFTITVATSDGGGGGSSGGGCFIASMGNGTGAMGLLSFGLLGTLVALLPRP